MALWLTLCQSLLPTVAFAAERKFIIRRKPLCDLRMEVVPIAKQMSDLGLIEDLVEE